MKKYIYSEDLHLNEPRTQSNNSRNVAYNRRPKKKECNFINYPLLNYIAINLFFVVFFLTGELKWPHFLIHRLMAPFFLMLSNVI